MFWGTNASTQSSRRSEDSTHFQFPKARNDPTYRDSRSKNRRCPSRSAVRPTVKDARPPGAPDSGIPRMKVPRQLLHKKLGRLVNPYEKPDDLVNIGLINNNNKNNSLHSKEESGIESSRHQNSLIRTPSEFRDTVKRSSAKFSLQLPASVTSFFPPKGYQFAGPSNRYCWQKGFSEDKPLGKGFTSTVYRGLDVVTGDTVAIKLVPKQKQRRLATDNYYRRLYHRLPLCPHPCLLRFRAFLEDAFYFYVITDLCRGLDLVEYTLQFYPGTIPIDVVRNIVIQILLGIQHLHQNHIIHRDIKLDNILFTDSTHQQIVIVDFDMGMMLDNPQPPRPVRGSTDIFVVGTTDYMAPEAYGGVYSEATDLWGFGVILYILLEGHFPFNISYLPDPQDVLNALKRKLHISPNVAKRLPLAVDLIHQLLCFDINKRITNTDDVLRHPWISRKGIPVDDSCPNVVGDVEIIENYSSMTTVSTAPTTANHLLQQQNNTCKKVVSTIDRDQQRTMKVNKQESNVNNKVIVDNSSSSMVNPSKKTQSINNIMNSSTGVVPNYNHNSNCTNNKVLSAASERIGFVNNHSANNNTLIAKVPSVSSSATSATLTPVLKPAIIHQPVMSLTMHPQGIKDSAVPSPSVLKKPTADSSRQDISFSSQLNSGNILSYTTRHTEAVVSSLVDTKGTASPTINLSTNFVTSSRVRDGSSYTDEATVISSSQNNSLPSSRVLSSPNGSLENTSYFSLQGKKLTSPCKYNEDNKLSMKTDATNKHLVLSSYQQNNEKGLDTALTNTNNNSRRFSVNEVLSPLNETLGGDISSSSKSSVWTPKKSAQQHLRAQSVNTKKSDKQQQQQRLSNLAIPPDGKKSFETAGNYTTIPGTKSVSEVIAAMKNAADTRNSTTSSTTSSIVQRQQSPPLLLLQDSNYITEKEQPLPSTSQEVNSSHDQNSFEFYKPAKINKNTINEEHFESVLRFESAKFAPITGGSLLSSKNSPQVTKASCLNTNSPVGPFSEHQQTAGCGVMPLANLEKKMSPTCLYSSSSSSSLSFSLVTIPSTGNDKNKKPLGIAGATTNEQEIVDTAKPQNVTLFSNQLETKSNNHHLLMNTEKIIKKEQPSLTTADDTNLLKKKEVTEKHGNGECHETMIGENKSTYSSAVPKRVPPLSLFLKSNSDNHKKKNSAMPVQHVNNDIHSQATNSPVVSLVKPQRRSHSMNASLIQQQKKNMQQSNPNSPAAKTLPNSKVTPKNSLNTLQNGKDLTLDGTSLTENNKGTRFESLHQNNNTRFKSPHQNNNTRFKSPHQNNNTRFESPVPSLSSNKKSITMQQQLNNTPSSKETAAFGLDNTTTSELIKKETNLTEKNNESSIQKEAATEEAVNAKITTAASRRLEKQDYLLKEKLTTSENNILAPRFMMLKNIIATRAVNTVSKRFQLNDMKMASPESRTLTSPKSSPKTLKTNPPKNPSTNPEKENSSTLKNSSSHPSTDPSQNPPAKTKLITTKETKIHEEKLPLKTDLMHASKPLPNIDMKTVRKMSIKSPGYLWSLLSKPHVMVPESSSSKKK